MSFQVTSQNNFDDRFKMRNKERVNTKSEEERLAQGLAPWTSMSFSLGGWLQFYLYGVARAIQARGLDRKVKYCGCSAGALAATGLTIGADFDMVVDYAKNDCLPRAYANIQGLFKLSDYVSEVTDICGKPCFNGIEPGQLSILTTRLPFLTSERVTQFDSYEDLKLSLLASAAAFPFASLVKRNEAWYIDGGLSDFQPVIDDETIKVSAFYFSDADIKPSRYVPLWWSFLPPNCPNTVDWLYNLGWEDANNYFDSRGIPSDFPVARRFKPLTKPSHPYDIPKQLSIRRLLGYQYSSLPAHIVIFILDILLSILFFFVFKPLALFVIYSELYLNVIIYGLFALIGEVMEGSVVKILAMMSYLTHIGFIGRFIQTTKCSIEDQTKTYYTSLWECVTCISSLSLFLRFISFKPSNVVLRKHKRLERLSLCYRLFRHII